MNQVAQEILLKAKKDVFSGNLGEHLTAFKGDGLDFREIRDYDHGDDIRKINWKASAKGAGIKTNVFNEERELNIVLAFMVSGSINFGSVKLKQEIVAEILALLSFSALKGHNRLQSQFFSDKSEIFFEPSKSNNIIYNIVNNAIEINTLGKEVNYKNFCNFINGVVRQKSLIFMVGDFYGDIDLSEIAHKNEVYALIVRDRIEENPMLNGTFELIDPNSLESNEISLNKTTAKEYQKIITQHDNKIQAHFLEHQIAFGKIYTDEDVFLRLSEIIKK
ncbi:hypothetical protein MNB_SV-14-652 [hydrothermal vent metagenome]|uniref:DUF58 domain-containing protein n=1 Tax=hydrothermal vent metagenome TaxID=652676 RepID=A0A1W1CB48_9ZZZZ